MTEAASDDQSYFDQDFPCIAVVGMAGRFPGAPDLKQFWHNLLHGIWSIQFFSPEELKAAGIPASHIKDPSYIPARGVLDDADHFDAAFFQVSPREAELMDPQHRIFLECAWSALEDAGYDPQRFDGKIGMFGGCSENSYFKHNVLPQPNLHQLLSDFQEMILSDKDYLTTRASYKLGLTGPSINVQSACSTSLVAVQLACLSLLNYQCDMALAGGASVKVPMVSGEFYQDGNIFSPDGKCRAFDASAAGAVGGDGVGIVVLRRLEDALADGDPIRAIIRSAAINNDGDKKVGYTAPGVDGQTDVIATAIDLAEVSAETITYVEAHGTATPIGDPIEFEALQRAYREHTDATGYCAIGTVKSNVGHLNAAAGVAGLIKTILALQHQVIPPSLHFETPNPHIDFASSPFFVNTEAQPWHTNGFPRRAGVSSFGVGGTNVHLILEEAPHTNRNTATSSDEQMLLLSARTEEALHQLHHRFGGYLQEHGDTALSDVAYTCRNGRRIWSHRSALLASSTQEAAGALQTPNAPWLVTGVAPTEERRPLVFLFPAQGAQRVHMGRALYEREASFREPMERCFTLIQRYLGYDLRDILYPSPEQEAEAEQKIDDHYYAGPALFSVCYSLATYWMSRGIRPDAVLGHSTGEYAAACVAGVFSLEDALRLFLKRAQLFRTLPAGAGLRISMSPEEIRPWLRGQTYLALHNGPRSCIVTGTTEDVESLRLTLLEQKLPVHRIRLFEAAHSPLMEPIAQALQEEARTLKLHPPQIPVMSGVTGTWMTNEEAIDPTYWVRHMLQPVQFANALQSLIQEAPYAFLEIGPYRSVLPIAVYNAPEHPVVASLPDPDNHEQTDPRKIHRWLQRTIACLWTHGVIDTDNLPEAPEGRRIPLPTYPFARQRYWLEAPHKSPVSQAMEAGTQGEGRHHQPASQTGQKPRSLRHSRPPLDIPYQAPQSKAEQILVGICEDLLGIEAIGVHDPFAILGADSLISMRIVQELERRQGIKLPPSAIFSGLTVSQLASFIQPTDLAETNTESSIHGAEPDVHKAHNDILVPLRPTGSKPPLFLVHPAAGVIFPYIALTHYLGPEQPVYALQASGLDGKSPIDQSCTEMAARYIREIQKLQPTGPYLLAGYSFGSYVCYEMALQLEAMGESILFLGLIDEASPVKGYRPTPVDVARILYGQSGRNFLAHIRDYIYLTQGNNGTPRRFSVSGLVKQLKQLPEKLSFAQWSKFLERSTMSSLLPEHAHLMALDHPAMGPMFKLFVLHTWLLYTYAPTSYRGSAVLFKSEATQNPWYQRKYPEPMLGWNKLVKGGVRIRSCKGDHMGMIRPPHVQTLAQALCEEIEEATR